MGFATPQLLSFLGCLLLPAWASDVATLTINGCICDKEWNHDKGGQSCSNYCCSFASEEKWCVVKDDECEDAAWGFCKQSDSAPGDAPVAGCSDKEGWRDTDGDGCSSYVNNQWCTAAGELGKGWHGEWGNPKTFNANGYTAFTACCACGGGFKGVVANPHAKRFTYAGCSCKKQWDVVQLIPASMSCTSSCCDPDNDPAGDWCLVEEEECESGYWGYCRPEEDKFEQLTASAAGGGKHGHCEDEKGWVDVDDEVCQSYASKAYCTDVGGYGLGWNMEWGTFADFAKDEEPANEACCACGGGERDFEDEGPGEGTEEAGWALDEKKRTTLANCECKQDWKMDGFGACDDYCCNKDNDQVGEWCMVVDPKCEDSDWGYCKDSGLGLEFQAKGPLQDAVHCSDTPGWRDADGDGCQTYEGSMWCTSGGKTGPGWHEEWGSVPYGAFTACCACGGGSVRKDEEEEKIFTPQGAINELKNLVNEVPEFMWWVASGPCGIDDNGCITSGNYPAKYSPLEQCQIGVDTEKATPIHVKVFETERKYDALKVNGVIYSGSRAPNGIIPSSTIFWGADSKDEKKGWKLCPRGEVGKRKPGKMILKALAIVTSVLMCSCCVAFAGLWFHTYRNMPHGDGLGAGPTKIGKAKNVEMEEA